MRVFLLLLGRYLYCMEIEQLHLSLRGLIFGKQRLSPERIRRLIELKKTVNRLAQTPYITSIKTKDQRKKFGSVLANLSVSTWGDYFQVETVFMHYDLSDQEFFRVIDTIYFDLIAAVKIFRRKPQFFLDTVLKEGLAAYEKPESSWDEMMLEQVHLYILLRYYQNMGLENAILNRKDELWFQSFVPSQSHVAS